MRFQFLVLRCGLVITLLARAGGRTGDDSDFLELFIGVGCAFPGTIIMIDEDSKWDEVQQILRKSLHCVGYMPGVVQYHYSATKGCMREIQFDHLSAGLYVIRVITNCFS